MLFIAMYSFCLFIIHILQLKYTCLLVFVQFKSDITLNYRAVYYAVSLGTLLVPNKFVQGLDQTLATVGRISITRYSTETNNLNVS